MEYVPCFSSQYHQFLLEIIDIFTNIICLSSFSLDIIYILNIALSINFSSFYPTTYNFFHTFLLVVLIFPSSCIYYMEISGKTSAETNIRPCRILHGRMFSVHLYFSPVLNPQSLQILPFPGFPERRDSSSIPADDS